MCQPKVYKLHFKESPLCVVEFCSAEIVLTRQKRVARQQNNEVQMRFKF